MSVRVTVHIDGAQLKRLALDPNEEIGRQVEARVRRVETMAKVLAPVDTGNLRRHIYIDGPRVGESTTGWDVVAGVAYAMWIIRGRREYRRGSGHIVHARAGARPFLVDALRLVFS